MVGRLRCLAVWTAATVVALAVARWSLAEVSTSGGFADLVASVAGLALAGCAAWAWTVCTVVVAQALHGPLRPTVGVPAWASRVVLAACGVAVLGVAPAQASPEAPPAEQATRAVLDGLPFPDRAVGPAHAAPAPERSPTASVVVRAGDSLWSIAAATLPADATDAQVAAATAALADLNRDVVTDPDLIHPGLRLRTPGS